MGNPEHTSDIFRPHQVPDREFAKEIRHQLSRILSSPFFAKSPQIVQLLSFLVEESLAGESNDARGNIKEYSIAVQLFGRPANFTSISDNIVRVEMRRLRSKLAQYYEEDGVTDPVLITIPKGQYVPVYRRLKESEFNLTGRTVSHYKLLQRQFVNRWQSTYDAQCLQLGRLVSLMLPTRLSLEDEDRRQRFFDGLRSAPSHPNIVSIHEVEERDARLIVVFASAPDLSLQQYVERRRISSENRLLFARSLASALASGHKAGLLHGNLNPETVRIDPEGEFGGLLSARILPFGFSPFVDLDHPVFQGFRPPEHYQGKEPDLRSDVWSFGALMWFAAHGVSPPSGDASSTQADGAAPCPFDAVVDKCLREDPAARYENAAEILADIPDLSQAQGKPSRTQSFALDLDRGPVLVAVLLLALLIAAIAALRIFGPDAQHGDQQPRVVVLPFENTGNDGEIAPYCRVIAELLSDRVAHLPGVQLVSSRSMALGRGQSMEFLRNTLQVNYVMDGALQKSGPEFHATIRLRHLPEHGYVWIERLDGQWAEISALTDRLAKKAAQGMHLKMEANEGARSAPVAAVNTLAQEAWIKGRFAVIQNWNAPSQQHFDDAQRRLLEALRVEPKYVDAIVDLGQLYLSAVYPPKGNQADLLDNAERLARNALALDPDNWRAQALLGGVYTDSGRPLQAVPFLRRAVQQAPYDATPHNFLSIAYESMGFWESSLAERELAARCDPLLSGISLGGLLLRARLGRLSESFAMQDMTNQAGQRRAYMHLLRGEPHLGEKILRQLEPPLVPAYRREFELLLALTRSLQGHPEIARDAIRKFAIDERSRNERFILLCAIAGDRSMLVKEIARHTYRREYRWVITEPLLKPYRTDPEFQAVVRELYSQWQHNLKEIGPSLPLQPPALPIPEIYFDQK